MKKQNQLDIKKDMEKIEVLIGKIMRIGVGTAMFVMLIGYVLLLTRHTTGYSTNTFPITLPAIIMGVIQFKPYAIMMLGILLLILTPLLRVAVSIYAFFKEKDHFYTRVTTFVLMILLFSLCLGYILH